MTIGSALIMLGFQAFLIYNLNISNDAMLFCGDIVRMIETAASPAVLFKDDCVQSFNTTWSTYRVNKE